MSQAEVLARAQEALREGRWDEACAAFEEVLRESDVPEALAGLGDALFWKGDVRRGIASRERAYATSRRAGDLFWAAESAIWLTVVYESAMGNMPVSRGWLARARGLVEQLDIPLMSAWLWVCESMQMGDEERCRELLERAIAVARQETNLDLELVALAELGLVLVKMGRTEEGFRCLDEAMAGALGGDGTIIDTVVMTSCSMLTACDLVGDLERATRWTRAADEFTRTQDGPYLYSYCRIAYGSVLVARGFWTEAERELTRAVETTRDVFPAMNGRALVTLARLRLRQGRLDQAQALLESVEQPLGTELVAAELALQRGEPAVAVTLLERWLNTRPVLSPLHSGGRGVSWEMASALSLLVDAHLASGDLDAATAVTERLRQAAEADGAGLAAPYAAHTAGRLHLAQDQRDASRCFEEAVERFARLELPLETGRARLDLARALADDQPAVAVSEARAALAGFDRLGASADADAAAALLRTWGVAGRTGPRDVGVLTRREQEILALLAAGLSNQEIAQRLYISRKTAAHHVSSLLAKLGLRNRAEAAAYASRASQASR